MGSEHRTSKGVSPAFGNQGQTPSQFRIPDGTKSLTAQHELIAVDVLEDRVRPPFLFRGNLSIWRLTDGGKKKSAPISLRTLSEQTGLSKRAIQDAADRLERRQLISIERQMPTAVPVYRLHKPWVR